MEKLTQLGFNSWFIDHLDSDKQASHQIARVISVHKDSYVISKGETLAFAELSGHLSYTAESSLDLPTTGDWVYADFYDDETHAIIHDVVTRKTLLKRKTAGKLVEFQLIAANIDVAFIIQSVDFNFNLSRLERYLVMVNEAGITPMVLLSKCDLITSSELEQIRSSVLALLPNNDSVYAFSNLSGENLDAIRCLLQPSQTYCLLGSSGVGKTTLLNSLLGQSEYETQTVSKKQNKGRHTTTSRELIQLQNHAMIIDTPGMRELGNLSVNSGIDETFSDITELAQHCRFNDCTHSNEKGCAVLAAIDQGDLSEQRYHNYLKIKNENAFNEMSYSEKRKKDRDFGKLVKNTMKLKKR